jgi:hypothetical protein
MGSDLVTINRNPFLDVVVTKAGENFANLFFRCNLLAFKEAQAGVLIFVHNRRGQIPLEKDRDFVQ